MTLTMSIAPPVDDAQAAFRAAWAALFPHQHTFALRALDGSERQEPFVLALMPFPTADARALAALLMPMRRGQASLVERWAGDPSVLACLIGTSQIGAATTDAAQARQATFEGFARLLGVDPDLVTLEGLAMALNTRLGIEVDL